MKKILKKCFALITCLFVIITSAIFSVGCGDNKTASNSDIYVLMLTNAKEKTFYESYFAELEEELGITITFEGVSYQDYDQKLSTAMQDRAPDIFYVRPGNLKQYVKEGILADLSSYLKSSEFTSEVDVSKLYSNVIDIYRYDGKNVSVKDDSAPVYAINQGLSYQGLGYNKALVERKETEIKAAGLPLPWELGTEGYPESYTFEQFSQVLSIVKDTTGGGFSGTDEIYGMNIPTEIMPLVWAQSGDILSNDNITINSEAFQTVFDWLKDNYKNGNISKAATNGEWSSKQVAFFTEVGSWEVSGYDFEFDMMPWPSKNGDSKWYGTIGTAGYGVYAESENLEMAEKIAARFLREDVQTSMVKKGLALPMYKEIAEGGYLTDNETYKPEHRKIFIDVISEKNGKYSPINNTYNSEWYDKFTQNIIGYMDLEQTAKDYLTSLQTEVQKLYDNQKNK